METFKFIKGKYTNEKVVADSGVIKAVLSNGTDVTNSVNDNTFQTAAFAGDNVSGKEVKVYTLRKSLSNINPVGEVTDGNNVEIISLGVTKSPSGVDLPTGAADELNKTQATATLPNEISWNNSSGDVKTQVNVEVCGATVLKTAKFTISGTVTVKKFVKAEGNLTGTNVYTESNLASGGNTGNGYYNDGRKCVVIEAYKTEEQETRTPENLGNDTYYNLVVNAQNGWMLGIDRDTIADGSELTDSFNIKKADFNEKREVKVSAWQETTSTDRVNVTATTESGKLKATNVPVGTHIIFDNNDGPDDTTDFFVNSNSYIAVYDKDEPNGSEASASTYIDKGTFYYNASTISYTKRSEATVKCDPNVYYQGLRLPSSKCFDKNGNELTTGYDLTNIDTVYKEKRDVTSGGTPYKYADTNTYYTYDSSDTVSSSSENCNINDNMLFPNQTPFKKVGDDSSIYLNERVDNVKRKVEFQ